MAALRLTPEALRAYTSLDHASTAPLLDAIDDALDLLEADPGDKRCRARSFGGGLWGITVPGDWLIVWEHDPEQDDLIRVRYLGADPFAQHLP